MKCPRCTSEVELGTKFCGKCGLPVRQMFQTPQAPQGYVSQAPQVQPMNYAPQATTQAPEKKKSKKTLIVVLIVLAVLLVAGIIALVFVLDKDKNKSRPSFGSASQGRYEDDDSQDDDEQETLEDDEPEDTPVVVEGEELEHTIMIYMVGSDLESGGGSATRDINEMLDAEFGEDTCIVMQTGGCSYWQNTTMKDGEVQRFLITSDGICELESLGATPMLTVDALADFITFAAQSYPADKYTLVLWDHGGGAPIGFGADEIYPYDVLYDYQIGEALTQAGISFECVVFDACNMCTLEVAMAIKDYAKYMIAAESYLLGVGMDYTAWLNYLGGEDVTALDSYEILATTYMESLEQYGVAASISMISLSKVEAVYDAYTEYISSVHDNILNGGYEAFVKARGDCGLYDGTDSVDIITLATTYPTEESADLMNAVVNAVYYTESDFAYGHGLAAYLPGAEIYAYDYARNNMEELEYDETILECYDDYVSINLTFLGSEYVENYAGGWYDSTVAYSYVEEGYEAGEHPLETVEKGGYYAIPLDEEDWGLISTVTVSVAIMVDEENAILLGQDYVYSVDGDNDIIIEPPENWVFVNDNYASYVGVDYYEDADSGDWSQTGLIFARCNGEDIALVVYYDETYPQGTVAGYIPYDFVTGESGNFTEFTEDDVVELVTPCINGITGETTYNNEFEESYYASELELDYAGISYGDTTVIIWYEITDVYGNVYSTEEYIF